MKVYRQPISLFYLFAALGFLFFGTQGVPNADPVPVQSMVITTMLSLIFWVFYHYIPIAYVSQKEIHIIKPLLGYHKVNINEIQYVKLVEHKVVLGVEQKQIPKTFTFNHFGNDKLKVCSFIDAIVNSASD